MSLDALRRRDRPLTPPGDDAIHHQPVAEAGCGRAQDMLAQHRAMGVHEREGGVVADRADVAEMIGEAFEFGHQRAQPHRARRHLDTQGGLDGAREGVARRRPCCRPRCGRRVRPACSSEAPAIRDSIPLCT